MSLVATLKKDRGLLSLLRDSLRKKKQEERWCYDMQDRFFKMNGYEYGGDGFTEWFLERLWGVTEQGKYLRSVQRDIKRLNWTVRSAESNGDGKWDLAYEKATGIVRIDEVVRMYFGDVNLNKNLRCPFHEDDSPSMHIYTDSNRFVCFACGASGSPFSFLGFGFTSF